MWVASALVALFLILLTATPVLPVGALIIGALMVLLLAGGFLAGIHIGRSAGTIAWRDPRRRWPDLDQAGDVVITGREHPLAALGGVPLDGGER